MPGHKAKLSAFFTVIDEVSDIWNFKLVDLPTLNGDWSNQISHSWLKSPIEQEASYKRNPQKWTSNTESPNTSGTSENPAPKIRVTRSENQNAVQSALLTDPRKRHSRSLVFVTFHSGLEWHFRSRCSWSLSSPVLQLWTGCNRLDERNWRCKRCWDRIEEIRVEAKLQTTTEANLNSGQVAIAIATTTKVKTLKGTRSLKSLDRQNQQGSRRQSKEGKRTKLDLEPEDEASCALAARKTRHHPNRRESPRPPALDFERANELQRPVKRLFARRVTELVWRFWPTAG